MLRLGKVWLAVVTCFIGLSLSRADEPSPPVKWAAPLAKLELRDGDGIVFLGDSITHQCLYTQYVEDYFFTRFPQMRLRFHNSGVGGDRCSDAFSFSALAASETFDAVRSSSSGSPKI